MNTHDNIADLLTKPLPSGEIATALLSSSSIGLAVYAEACISLVFGVSRVTWFDFSRWYLSVVLGFPQKCVGLCVCRGSHTDNFCF